MVSVASGGQGFNSMALPARVMMATLPVGRLPQSRTGLETAVRELQLASETRGQSAAGLPYL
jgi:hypothetical protein